jgi:hypothetical protein
MSVQLLKGTLGMVDAYVVQDFQAAPLGDLGTDTAVNVPAISNDPAMSLGTITLGTYG